MKSMTIGGRSIGAGHPCWIVAEVSANHNQHFERAVEIVRAAKRAGADAVKLQTYTADTLTIDSDRECFRIGGDSLWAGKTLYELYGEAYTPWEWHEKLMDVARSEGLVCFSTPFDATAVDLLERLRVPAHKIASFELVDIPLLQRVASTGKPVIMSTGMATLAEIEEAVAALRAHGTTEIALLKCTSAYPAAPMHMNLRTIPDLAERFDVVSGLSDHTMGSAAAVAAVTLGAGIIEKHFTLRRADGGPDSAFSMEPEEFAAMARDIRQTESALGSIAYTPTAEEAKNLQFRRSLFVAKDMAAGETFTEHNVRSVRPANGLHPRHLRAVLGRKAAVRIERGTPLAWNLIQGE
ncbi:MAG TPA: pseudaminic acid synthase [Vicinamibacterales bacterium]|jgi:pseudaminic acid synthase|nr:pseudaminic acid synthase [Vicinamibacterales bacterium]